MIEELRRRIIRCACTVSHALSINHHSGIYIVSWNHSAGSSKVALRPEGVDFVIIPLAGAIVDIWHCDAQGQYSDVNDGGQGFNTIGKKFLRGYQTTDASGTVQFTTIYPGWYQGRTVHIHFKIRENLTSATAYEFTSQLYFNDTLTDQVYTQQPYAARGPRDTLNSNDRIYSDGGNRLTLTLASGESGYTGTFDIALQI